MVRFRDGDTYLVRIISTMHAEAGDDNVAEVLQSASASTGGTIPVGSFMNFLLGDVAEVIVGAASVFARTSDTEPATAPDPPTLPQ